MKYIVRPPNLINPGFGRNPASICNENSQAIKSEGDLDDLRDDMNPAVDLLEQIWQDSLELDRAWEARAIPLYIQLKRRHTWWMSSLFRTRVWNDADIEELMNETFARCLERLRRTFWATNGVHSQSEPIVQAGRVIALRLLPAKPIADLESYTFRSPGGWLRAVARSVLNKYASKGAIASERAKEFRRAAKFPTRRNGKPQHAPYSWLADDLYGPPRNIEKYLVAECRAREIRERYIAALTNLPPVQRAAWIFCKDELLTHDEAEPMLAPILHWRTARAALRRKPLQDAEVSLLLSRKDVSPDVSKAADKLADQLLDLDPFRASREPALMWSREYLGGFTSHRSSFRSVRLLGIPFEQSAQHEDAGPISERDRDFIRAMVSRQRQNEITCRLKQESISAYKMDVKPGWVQAPEPDAPEYVELIQTIGKQLKARKRCTTIAKVLNATHVPPVFGNTWHHTAVRLIALRARLIIPARKSAPSASPGETLTEPAPRGTAGNKAPGHSQAGKKVSRTRKRVRKAKQRRTPVQKAPPQYTSMEQASEKSSQKSGDTT